MYELIIIIIIISLFYYLHNKKNNLFQVIQLLEIKQTNLQTAIDKEKYNLVELEMEIQAKKELNESIVQIQKDNLHHIMQLEKERQVQLIEQEVKDWEISAQEAANTNAQLHQEVLTNQMQNLSEQLATLQEEVLDYKNKRDVINQAILREREISENLAFYSINVDENIQYDLRIIDSFKTNIRKIDLLDKIIYDNYIKKSVDDMIKRVLQNRHICGIYKITRLKTGEIYIGKSTDIYTRWQQHCKSCYHCGTISHSALHSAMEKDGIWNWTFEVIEETTKDKLTEREKYWINFYDSKKFGLNQREG